MSAKIMKALASGECRIRNNRSGEVRLYWDDGGKRKFIDLAGHSVINLLAHGPVESFRKSQSLKTLAYENHISLVEV